jgi:hypothetical protein
MVQVLPCYSRGGYAGPARKEWNRVDGFRKCIRAFLQRRAFDFALASLIKRFQIT